ncbi:outer membrane efflux protein [Gemmatimonas aurantiaca T-27]|uniref:Outer membrane efflux protein n=2 Tax=Gemmatimonas aurantiaca TaxID=173480 RepID=C1AE70_GEMAT|nr:TolC family protein [Gemmatimonas aurantiaca]BAH40797.1 outer membrane efflux protein [Gemmatimonas aurantiaca T-27]
MSSASRRTFAAAIVLTPAITAAQQAPPPADSQTARAILDGYVSEALSANLALAQQTAALRRANAGLREANGRFLPSVGLNARYSEFSGVVNIGDFINPAYAALNQLIGEARFPTNVAATLPFRQETKLEMTLPLFNDALFGARAAARAQRDFVGAGRQAAMRQLAADVQLAWLGYATASRAVETFEATVPVLDEHMRVSERLIGAGQATPDVLLRARAERSELQQQLDDARRQRDAARRAVNMLRNRDADTEVRLAADSSIVHADTVAADALVAHALARREEIAQATGGIRLAQAQERVATASYLPNLALAASYGVQGNSYRFDRNSDVALASLVLSWNLFNGTQDAARREQAQALRSEAEYRQQEAQRAIRLQVDNAIDAVRVARSGLTTADDRYNAAQRAFTLVQRRYAEGLATPVDFLSARTAFTAAAINQVVTRFALASRLVELERAAALRTLPN